MRVLVTGATGALGRALISQLRSLGGSDVLGLGFYSQSSDQGIIKCDIRDDAGFFSIFNSFQPDLVMHLAASFSSDLTEGYAVNVLPARNLLEVVKSNKLRTRVVLVGSAAEYGVVRPDENPIREDHSLFPLTPYGVSKAWQTQLLGLYSSVGIDVVCARIFNLYGPGTSARLFAGRVATQIEQILAGQRSVIEVGSLSAIRDYLSTDAAASQLLTIARKGVSGQVYHVASGRPVVMREFLIQQLVAYGLAATDILESPGLSNHIGYDVPAIYADINKTLNLKNMDAINAYF